MGVFVLTHVSSRDMSFAAFFVKKKKRNVQLNLKNVVNNSVGTGQYGRKWEGRNAIIAVKLTLNHPATLIKSNGLFKTTPLLCFSLHLVTIFSEEKKMPPTSNKLPLLFSLK